MSAREAKRRLGAPDYMIERMSQGVAHYVGQLPYAPSAERLYELFGCGVYFVRKARDNKGYEVHVGGRAKP